MMRPCTAKLSAAQGNNNSRTPKAKKSQRERFSRFFTIPVTQGDVTALRDILGVTLGYDTRRGQFKGVQVIDVSLYDPSGGPMSGQLFAVIEVDGFVPPSVFRAYFPTSTAMRSTWLDAIAWKRFFSEIKL